MLHHVVLTGVMALLRSGVWLGDLQAGLHVRTCGVCSLLSRAAGCWHARFGSGQDAVACGGVWFSLVENRVMAACKACHSPAPAQSAHDKTLNIWKSSTYTHRWGWKPPAFRARSSTAIGALLRF